MKSFIHTTHIQHLRHRRSAKRKSKITADVSSVCFLMILTMYFYVNILHIKTFFSTVNAK